jgi:pyruvyltransferase
LRAYWWRHADKFHGLNFGDELNQLILQKLGASFQLSSAEDSELVVCGSILEQLPADWAGSVAGAGKLRESSRIHLPDARVFAVRGKLTLAGMPGVKDVALGDPALLLPKWIRQPLAKYDLGVVPHWSDKDLHRRFSYGHLIDVRQPPARVISEILSCKRIVSSSLHGLIVADAYGIPRQAELFEQAEREGGDFKFRDYMSVFGSTDPHFGHMWQAPRDEVARIQAQLLPALQQAVAIDLPGREHRRHPLMSILVPFRDDGEHRTRVWKWLKQYWRSQHMSAEIIQGFDDSEPFSKSRAVNQAASLARGRVFVVLDADALLTADALVGCAEKIDAAVTAHKRLWYMPYDRLYRLNEATTLDILKSRPNNPLLPVDPPPPSDLEPGGADPKYGHRFGAMCQIMPREAFTLVHGMPPGFKGWGGEDKSFLHALDTLYAPHEVADNRILHFWHQRIGSLLTDRKWVGQSWEAANSRLAQRYAAAAGEPGYMRALVDEEPLGW